MACLVVGGPLIDPLGHLDQGPQAVDRRVPVQNVVVEAGAGGRRVMPVAAQEALAEAPKAKFQNPEKLPVANTSESAAIMTASGEATPN